MIQTKIAQILSPTHVVLAAGKADGVKEGMEFVIYDLSDPVLDPETREPLGELELVKGRIKVTHVQDRISTASTLFRPEEWYSRAVLEVVRTHKQERLNVNGGVAVQTDRTVCVGDRVRSVT